LPSTARPRTLPATPSLHDALPISAVVQAQLFKYTQLQQTFGINMVALVGGRPKTLSLRELVQHYIDHRHEVVVRRTEFDLRKAEDRKSTRLNSSHVKTSYAVFCLT